MSGAPERDRRNYTREQRIIRTAVIRTAVIRTAVMHPETSNTVRNLKWKDQIYTIHRIRWLAVDPGLSILETTNAGLQQTVNQISPPV